MSLKFNCSNAGCQRRIEVEDSLAGTEVVCPACGVALRIPASHDIRFSCSGAECGQHIVVDVSEAGRFMKCPACGKAQRVPGDPPKPLVSTPLVPTISRFPWKQLKQAKPLRRFKHEDQFVVWFFLVALGGLLVLGMTKVATPWLKPGYPGGMDAVFAIRLPASMFVLGLLECGTVAVCAGVASTRLAAVLLLWYAANWWVYRLGQMWLDQRQPMPALGVVGDMLGLRDATTDRLMMVFSLNLAVGAAVIAWRQWRLEQEPERKQSDERKAKT